MYFYILSFLSIVAQLALGHATPSHAVLDRQCWTDYPLNTANLYSLPDQIREYVYLIQPSIPNDRSDTKEKDNYTPWSYPPTCTHILQSINDKLCVYTSTSFSHGRGISIFTTPSLAEQFASLPAFQDPPALDSQNINTYSGAWHTSSLPGKGIGMLASRSLQFKDRVTAYTPAFLAYLETELSTLDREIWWRKAIEQLPEDTKDEFLSLTYVFGDERVRVQDIVKANTFQVDVGGGNHLAVFAETSRLNHACNPNAQYVIDTDLLTHFVHATRPIAKDEEITIAYTSPLDPTSTRHHHLSQGFHFTCTCPRCTSPSSDSILSRITTLQNHLNDWSPTSLGSPALAEELLQLHRDEGLEGFMDVAYGFAALAWNAVGDGEKARMYAVKAKEAILMKDGVWAGNLRVWEEVLGGPEGHWSWRRRVNI